jgi:hypothetical protein
MAGSHNGAVTTSAAESLPDDVETLKTMLLAERQAHRTEVHNRALLIEQLKHRSPGYGMNGSANCRNGGRCSTSSRRYTPVATVRCRRVARHGPSLEVLALN